MSKFLLITVFFILASCTDNKSNQTLVLNYEDFGPQVIAHNALGMAWWQWQSHGASNASDYRIKVVVYRNVDIEVVKELYPVRPENKQDYRYLDYITALEYLDNAITDNVDIKVTKRLENTKIVLLEGLD